MKKGLSNSEEKAKRVATKAEHKLAIDAYLTALDYEDQDSIDTLRTAYPQLTNVFNQLEKGY